MKRFLITTATVVCISLLFSDFASAQGGAGGGGGAAEGGFAGADGEFGQGRVTSAEEIQDNRAQTALGENNRALGGGQANANNMNFLNSLFGGGVNNSNANQNTPLRGRSVRAPFRLGFKFTGASVETGLRKLNARIVRLPKFQDQKISAVLQKKTLILIGEVSSQEQADLAGRIARFEPGVDEVKNLLTVTETIQ